MNSYEKGKRSEKLAIVILWIKGYKIMARRYKTPVGEVDLIAQRRHCFVFVEVKRRVSQDQALKSLSLRQQKRIRRAAEFYFVKHPKLKITEIRFDVIAFWSWKWCHLKNAW